MSPEELRESLRQQPFEPFRILVFDGTMYDIRHPDLLWVGQRSAYVGLTGDPGQTFFERSVKLDLLQHANLPFGQYAFAAKEWAGGILNKSARLIDLHAGLFLEHALNINYCARTVLVN